MANGSAVINGSGRIPPRWIWVVCGFLAGIAIWVRISNVTGDNAVTNVVTLIVAFLGVVIVSLWFLFLSGYSTKSRLAAAATILAAVGLFAALFEIEQVTGELVPRFRPRFVQRPDELLETPDTVADEAAADLASTTPFDFPQFLGPMRRARTDAVQLDTDWEAHPPELVWKQPIGAGWSAFAAVNGFAVTMEQRGDDELVTCYEVGDGRLVWSYGTRSRHITVLGGVGPRSTPTIEKGRVYALGATGKLVCLDGGTGEVVWRDDLLARYGLSESEELQQVAWGRAASPLVVDDLLIVPAGGSEAGTRHSLIAYSKQTGDIAWQAGNRQISYASPVSATLCGIPQVVSVNEDTVSGHRLADGKVLWEHPWPGKSNAAASTSQPVPLDGDRVFISKGYGEGAMMLRLDQQGDELQATEVWRDRRLLKTKFTNVVASGDYLYGLSDGILECVAADDGRRIWKRGRYHHGQVLGVNALLLVQAEFGDVVLVEATPERHNELARLQALDEKTWSNPCLYGPYLLVRSAEHACCYKLPLRDE